MESSTRNYESKNGTVLDFHQDLGAGATSEAAFGAEGPYACLEEMDLVIRELDSVEKICRGLLKKLQGPEGPGPSQSDESQYSMDSAKRVRKENRKRKKEKFVLPSDVIDLTTTSEDSCDSDVSRRLNQETPTFDQVQSPAAVTSVAIEDTRLWPPFSSPGREETGCKPKQLDPPARQDSPRETTIISDDEWDLPHEPFKWQGLETAPEQPSHDEDDALASVWQEMERALCASGNTPTPIASQIRAKQGNVDGSVKRPKLNNPKSAVLYSPGRPSIQLATDENALVPVESKLAPKLNKRRGRPRKEVGFSVEVPKQGSRQPDVGTLKTLTQGTVNSSREKKGKKVRKGDDGECAAEPGRASASKGKEKEVADDYDADEDDVDDDENCRKTEKHDDELKMLSSKMNGEKVDYEPYRWRKENEEQDDEDEDVLDLFNEMRIAMACTQVPEHEDTVPELAHRLAAEDKSVDENVCQHTNFDFDEDVGYYCEDCGSVGIDMPSSQKCAKKQSCTHINTQFDEEVGHYCTDCGNIRKDMPQLTKKTCEHRNKGFTDEAGLFCIDCGRVGRDIQNMYLPTEDPKSSRKPRQLKKDEEDIDEIPDFHLELPNSNDCDFDGADVQLHPLFVEKLNPHQKKGFKFLVENLLGDKKHSHESVGCVLAHAPGTGKTFLMISFIQSFLARFPHGRPLIIAPKIILHSWVSEFDKWKVEEIPIYNLHESKVIGEGLPTGHEDDEDAYAKLPSHVKKSLKESRAKVLEEWHKARGVLLVSYTLFSILVSQGVGENVTKGCADYQIAKALLEAPNLVVLDEGHLARNVKTKISQALLAMQTKRRVLLSGTLFQNNFKELYTLLKLCRDDFMISDPASRKQVSEACSHLHGLKNSNIRTILEKLSKKELMGVEEKIFQEEIGDKLEKYVKSGESRTTEIEHVVKKLQSLTASFVDWYPGDILKKLPGLFEYSVHLNLTQIQQQEIARLASGQQAKYHMSRQCRVLAACIHPSLVNHGEDVNVPFTELDASSKADVELEAFKGVKMIFISQLMEKCLITQEKLLIFCSTLTPLKYIADLFHKMKNWDKGNQILQIDGTMQEHDRQKVIKQFNDKKGSSCLMLASTKACKEGITLVGASRVVIIDNPDNPAVVRQAVSRAFRIGQEKKVFVYRLVTTNQEEEEIFRRSVNKERLSQVLLDPVSTIARMGSFLQELTTSEVEDELLQKMVKEDARKGKYINVINRYNAAG